MPRIPLSPIEIARLDGDPGLPDNGRLDVKAIGIDPDIDETSYSVAVAGPDPGASPGPGGRA